MDGWAQGEAGLKASPRIPRLEGLRTQQLSLCPCSDVKSEEGGGPPGTSAVLFCLRHPHPQPPPHLTHRLRSIQPYYLQNQGWEMQKHNTMKITKKKKRKEKEALMDFSHNGNYPALILPYFSSAWVSKHMQTGQQLWFEKLLTCQSKLTKPYTRYTEPLL